MVPKSRIWPCILTFLVGVYLAPYVRYWEYSATDFRDRISDVSFHGGNDDRHNGKLDALFSIWGVGMGVSAYVQYIGSWVNCLCLSVYVCLSIHPSVYIPGYLPYFDQALYVPEHSRSRF